MKTPKLLRIYLQDHDALAYVTIQVVRRTRKSNSNGPLGSLLDEILQSAVQHESRLHELMDHLGVRRRRDKRAALWAAERFGRMKLNGRLVRYSDLSRVFELEGVSLLLTMRLSLLDSLLVLGDDDRLRLGDLSLGSAGDETRRHLDRLADQHRSAASKLAGRRSS